METPPVQQLLAPYLPHPLQEAQTAQIYRYLELLIRWNRRINLTAVRKPEEVVTRHFGESLFTASRLLLSRRAGALRIVDVGSGAGFPGLAIRIYAPVAVTLIESRQRKAAFLREAVRVLGFHDVEVFNDRAERFVPTPERAALIVTLRAVEKFEQAVAAAASILNSYGQQSREQSYPDPGPGPKPGAGRMALLIGSEQVHKARELVPGVIWEPPLPIPGSYSRVLLIGTLTGNEPDSG
jgi:16S rRNA (guanine527-N7)-methyltransferase